MPNSTCFVPGCKTGYKSCKERVSVFTPPRDEQLFRKWERAIPRADKQLTRDCVVCAKHFPESEITRERTVVHEGKVILRFPIKPELRDSAVPSLFPNCPGYPSKPARKTRKSPKKRAQLPKNRNAKRKAEDIATEDITTDDICIENVASPKKHAQLPKNCNVKRKTEDITTEYIRTDDLCIENIAAEDTTEEARDAVSTSTVPCEEPPHTSDDIFRTLQMDINKLKMTDETWAVQFRFTSPKFISVAQMAVNYENKPYISKQVLITEDMQVQLFVNCKPLKHEGILPEGFVVENLENIQDLALHLSTQRVCEGGPKLKSYPHVLPEKAFLAVDGHWRHVKCPLVTLYGSTCRYCMQLEKVLQQNVRRQRREKKFTRIVSSHSVKSVRRETRKYKCNQTKALRKSKQSMQLARLKARKLQDEMKTLPHKSLN